MKIEKKSKCNLLESEAYILTSIKGFGIPQIISFGNHGPFKILIEGIFGINQRENKKRMKAIGKVSLSQDAFMAVLKITDDDLK